MIKYIFWFASLILLVGCKKNEAQVENDIPEIFQKLHGKYNVISSISDQSVDVNMDGKGSANLLEEINDLPSAILEIRIIGKSRAESSFIFTQFWPEQHLSEANPGVVVMYATQGATRTFDYNLKDTGIRIEYDKQYTNLEQFPLPDEVKIQGKDLIKVITSKKLYTKNGWTPVKITTVYKRYTLLT